MNVMRSGAASSGGLSLRMKTALKRDTHREAESKEDKHRTSGISSESNVI